MRKKSIIFIFIVVIFIFLEWGNLIIPLSLEISDVEVTELIGMDLPTTGDFSISVIFSGDEEEGKNNERLVTINSDSFTAALRGLQNYEDKIFIGSHVRDIIIGEELAKNNMNIWLDFASKSSDIRSNSNVYIAKEMTSTELFSTTLENEYSISDRIFNIVRDSRFDNEARKVRLLDVMDMFLDESRIGVIPCITTVKNGERQIADYTIEREPDSDISRIELAGYGIINGGKLVGYLNSNETDGYDYVNNLINEDALTVIKDGEEYGVDLINSKTKFYFEFSNDDLTKIIIKTDTKNYIAETSSGENIFAHNVNEIEKLEDEIIANKIRTVIDRAQSEKIDFIEIGKKLEFKHPYKWRQIKDKWDEIFPNVPVEIEVNSKINREYDMLSTSNEQ